MIRHRNLPAAAALLSLGAIGLQAGDLPRQAPEFTMQLTGGKILTLSQYKGKPVVLAFILTSCPHCQRTVGYLSKAQTDYGPRGLQVLASALDDNAPLALPLFLKNFNPPFPVGYNTGVAALKFMQIANLPMMPLLAFIDSQGIIRAQFEGHDGKFFGDDHEQNLRAQIEALLKRAAPVRKK